MQLNRDQILAAPDLVRELVPVPEWGEGAEVLVTSMTGLERDRWDKSTFTGKAIDMIGYKSRLLAATVVNEGGTRVFTDEDAAALGQKNAAVIERVFMVSARLNGLLATAAAGIEKNSDAAPSQG